MAQSGASRRIMGEMQKMSAGVSEKWSAAPIEESDLFRWTGEYAQGL